MPKTKISDIIVGRARISGFDTISLSKKSGIALNTLYRRLRQPENFTLSELYFIDRLIHFSDEEILFFVRRK